MISGTARLDEFDKDEWRDRTRPLWPPGYTEADFENAWNAFVAMKRRKSVQ